MHTHAHTDIFFKVLKYWFYSSIETWYRNNRLKTCVCEVWALRASCAVSNGFVVNQASSLPYLTYLVRSNDTQGPQCALT